MAPSYLENQLGHSLQNLGLETIDVYYIHNPETQLEGVTREEFVNRVRAAFEFLEAAAADGRIGIYGTATWNGYRQAPDSRDYLSLSSLVDLAREVGGSDHHFRVVQLPFNLGMPEALTAANQAIEGETVTILEAASRLGITVMCSASIFQAKLAQNLPRFVGAALTGLSTDAQRAIQFVRSTPGVTTALVGMSQRSHVEENLMVARTPPASLEQWLRVFDDHDADDE
jgi:aryl-alcohol dehydrogenase-like predicted oxidoreductase